jgi:hypothetical protein
MERTTRSISQFKKIRVSNLAPWMKTVVVLDVSGHENLKQMRAKIPEVEWRSCLSSNTIQVEEFTKLHCCTHDEQSRFRILFAPNHQNSWSLWFIEDEAKGILHFDQELKKFGSREDWWRLKSFCTFGGKNSWKFLRFVIMIQIQLQLKLYTLA